MKVARRFVAVVVILIVTVMGWFAFVAVREESRIYEQDLHGDHEAVARAVSASASAVWEREGEAGAARVVRAAGFAELRAPTADVPLRIDLVAWPSNVVPFETQVRGANFETYAPIGHTRFGIRVSEPRRIREALTRRTWQRWALTGSVLTVSAAAIVLLLGGWLIARPVSRLAAHARRIGLGDLRPEPIWLGNDELSELGREMNKMCIQLDEANASLALASEHRIAAIHALRHADRLGTVGQLAAGVAHELGTPLNVVQGRAQLIADDASVDAANQKNARVVVEQVDRMAKIIRQLLDFARRSPDTGNMAQPLAVVQKTVDLLTAMARKHSVMLEVVASDEGKGALVSADEGLLGQVLTNLVVNGIQAMPNEGGSVTIEVSTAEAKPPADVGGEVGRFVAVDVRDEGSGIAAEHLEHIFEPFFTTKDVGEGTGLGLSVSYGIVRDFGGWITVRSLSTQGSAFTVWLPLQNAPVSLSAPAA